MAKWDEQTREMVQKFGEELRDAKLECDKIEARLNELLQRIQSQRRISAATASPDLRAETTTPSSTAKETRTRQRISSEGHQVSKPKEENPKGMEGGRAASFTKKAQTIDMLA